ncbi:MAG TPA: PIG-L deacetylase family protein, partial [Acidobacteriota bacterium]|nr:PIG-L deacetylase family protein [Acidobacteriota bacterium]
MKRILGEKILFVTAHPDDESYLAAGTMLKNHQAGGTSYVACATFGEKGKSHIKGTVTSKQLKRLRKRELLAVSKFLKVSGLLMPGLPDAELGKKSNQDAFFKKLLAFASKHRPSLVISFGKDGISGHVDHISVGKVAKEVARELKVPFLAFSAPPELHKSIEVLKRRRKHGKYVKALKHQTHDIEIPINPTVKLKALRFHKSQHGSKGPFADFPPKTVKQFLTR